MRQVKIALGLKGSPNQSPTLAKLLGFIPFKPIEKLQSVNRIHELVKVLRNQTAHPKLRAGDDLDLLNAIQLGDIYKISELEMSESKRVEEVALLQELLKSVVVRPEESRKGEAVALEGGLDAMTLRAVRTGKETMGGRSEGGARALRSSAKPISEESGGSPTLNTARGEVRTEKVASLQADARETDHREKEKKRQARKNKRDRQKKKRKEQIATMEVVEEHAGEGKKRKTTSSERLVEGLSKKVKG